MCEELLGAEIRNMVLSYGVELFRFETVDSTQMEAKRYAQGGGLTPALFISSTQSDGCGRMGRSFYSPSGTGIYMTLLLDVTNELLTEMGRVTSAVAVAVTDAIEETTGIECKIKWVNDIYVDGYKVCGILAQTFAVNEKRYLAIGVGINVCTLKFPECLRGIAGSLLSAADTALKGKLTLAVFEKLYSACKAVKENNILYMEKYRKRSCVIGSEIVFFQNGARCEGFAEYIDDGGGLVVRCGEEYITLAGGEITLRIKNGGRADG